MFFVKINGGLGNQMFQYAFGKALKSKFNQKVIFDLSEYYTFGFLKKNSYRDFELDIFNIDFKLDKFFLIFLKLLIKLKIIKIFSEKKLFTFEKINSINHFTYFDGYWQNEKYFKDIRNQLLVDFNFKNKLNEKNKKLVNEINNLNSVSVHIRRGDYVNCGAFCITENKNNYYSFAIKFIKKKVKKPKFFVFSDDVKWVKKNMGGYFGNAVYVDFNKGKNSFKDMGLMSLCKHNIIANSSFSWWGAWLNTNKNKIVIAPKKWATQEHIITVDLIPKSWIMI
jgi:hypothetical protein